MGDTLIPKGFFPIALTDLHNNIATCYYNKERHLLLVRLNDSVVGPIEPSELESLLHVLKDVAEMRGRFMPLPEVPDDRRNIP